MGVGWGWGWGAHHVRCLHQSVGAGVRGRGCFCPPPPPPTPGHLCCLPWRPAESFHWGAPPAELGLDLPPRGVIAPKVGSLVLFPAYVWHGTVPIAAGERLNIAFDVVSGIRMQGPVSK